MRSEPADTTAVPVALAQPVSVAVQLPSGCRARRHSEVAHGPALSCRRVAPSRLHDAPSPPAGGGVVGELDDPCTTQPPTSSTNRIDLMARTLPRYIITVSAFTSAPIAFASARAAFDRHSARALPPTRLATASSEEQGMRARAQAR